jgi:hypothetical protein
MNSPMAPPQQPRGEPKPESPKGDLIVPGEASKLPFLGGPPLEDVAEQAAADELLDRVTVSLVRREQRKRWKKLQKRLLILFLVIGMVAGGLWAARKYSREVKNMIPAEWLEELEELGDNIKSKPVPPDRKPAQSQPPVETAPSQSP